MEINTPELYTSRINNKKERRILSWEGMGSEKYGINIQTEVGAETQSVSYNMFELLI
jgi:hypothetical protein